MPVDHGMPLGERIVVVGASCSGKSTLGAQLSEALGLPFVELDALFWEPNWTEPDREVFRARVREATSGDSWVVAGNYLRDTMPSVWPRTQTVIWLDFGLPRLTWRVLRRSYRRWRENELLWGTNTERFWSQLKLWSPKDSLIAFNVKTHRMRRGHYVEAMRHPRWSEIRFIQLRSPDEVREFVAQLGARQLPTAAAEQATGTDEQRRGAP